MSVPAVIALGSNLDNPRSQVLRAFECLGQLDETRLVLCSSLYCSRPQGPQDQDDFINAAAAIETTLAPQRLLAELKRLENQFGRVKKRHWGERIIDLDIIFYGELELDQPELIIPHPRAMERDFVMVPILEILPDCTDPKGVPISRYLEACSTNHLSPVTQD